jgi:hypothetical protein
VETGLDASAQGLARKLSAANEVFRPDRLKVWLDGKVKEHEDAVATGAASARALLSPIRVADDAAAHPSRPAPVVSPFGTDGSALTARLLAVESFARSSAAACVMT